MSGLCPRSSHFALVMTYLRQGDKASTFFPQIVLLLAFTRLTKAIDTFPILFHEDNSTLSCQSRSFEVIGSSRTHKALAYLLFALYVNLSMELKPNIARIASATNVLRSLNLRLLYAMYEVLSRGCGKAIGRLGSR